MNLRISSLIRSRLKARRRAAGEPRASLNLEAYSGERYSVMDYTGKRKPAYACKSSDVGIAQSVCLFEISKHGAAILLGICVQAGGALFYSGNKTQKSRALKPTLS